MRYTKKGDPLEVNGSEKLDFQRFEKGFKEMKKITIMLKLSWEKTEKAKT